MNIRSEHFYEERSIERKEKDKNGQDAILLKEGEFYLCCSCMFQNWREEMDRHQASGGGRSLSGGSPSRRIFCAQNTPPIKIDIEIQEKREPYMGIEK